jgi:hypothetical protein
LPSGRGLATATCGACAGRKVPKCQAVAEHAAKNRSGSNRSKVETDGFVLFGDEALLEIDIEGALRGLEYGAIDALGASLDGDLKLVFDFLPSLSFYAST